MVARTTPPSGTEPLQPQRELQEGRAPWRGHGRQQGSSASAAARSACVRSIAARARRARAAARAPAGDAAPCARRLRDRRRAGRPAPVQVGGGPVEIPSRGVGDAVAVLAIGGQAEILRQHRRMAVAQRQRDRRAGLHRLGPQRARPGMLHARDLHGQRGSAGGMAAADVLPQSPQHGGRIDAGVQPEPPVLQRQRRSDDAWRRVDRPIAVLHLPAAIHAAGFMSGLGEEAAVAIRDERRGGGCHERRTRGHGDCPGRHQACRPRHREAQQTSPQQQAASMSRHAAPTRVPGRSVGRAGRLSNCLRDIAGMGLASPGQAPLPVGNAAMLPEGLWTVTS